MSEREVLRSPDEAALVASTAGMLTARLVERQADAGIVHLVLTGGGVGTALLAELATPPFRDAVDWSRVEVWWGDERFLATDDPERNETAARVALLDEVPVEPARVHPIDGPDRAASAEASAAAYADLLAARAPDGRATPAFDVVLLGIGPDGHVASLFPEMPAVHVVDRSVVAVHGAPKPPATRVTMTFPALNAARDVLVLAAGREKSDAVRLACDASAGPLQVPASGVHGIERTIFCVDEDAAARLPTTMGRPVA